MGLKYFARVGQISVAFPEPFKYDFNALVVGYNTCNVCGVEPSKRRSDRFVMMALICFGCVVEVY